MSYEHLEPRDIEQIEVLTLPSDGSITDVSGLNELKSLLCFDASWVGLETFPVLEDMNGLVSLNLSWNALSELGDLSGTPDLVALFVTGNQLTHLPGLAHLPLDLIRADVNQLAMLPDDLPASMSYLRADHNRLEQLPDLDHMTNLSSIILHENALSLPPNMENLPHLVRVQLEGNPLDVRSCGRLQDVADRVNLTYDPTSSGQPLHCDRSVWLTGLGSRAGLFEIDLVTLADDPLDTVCQIRWLDRDGGLITEEMIAMTPHSAIRLSAENPAVASVSIQADQPVYSVLSFSGDDDQDYAVEGSPILLDEGLVPHLARDVDVFDTVVHLTDFTDSGTTIALETSQVDPGATHLEDHTRNYSSGPGMTLSLDLEAELGEAVIANAGQGRIHTGGSVAHATFETADGRGIGAWPIARKSQLFNNLYFPHVTTGPGWWTGLSLANPGPIATDVTVYGYDDQVGFSLIHAARIEPYSTIRRLAGEFFLDTGGVTLSAVQVYSPHPITGMMIFGREDTGSFSALPAATQRNLANRLVFPAIRDNETHWTGIVIRGANAAPIDVTVNGFDAEGVLLGTATYQIVSQTRLIGATTGPNGLLDLTPDVASQLAYLIVEGSRSLHGLAVISDRASRGTRAYGALPAPTE